FEYNVVSVFVGGLDHKELAAEVYRNSTTIVKNEQLLPLNDEEKVLVICSSSDVKSWAEDKDDEASNFGEAIRTYHVTADIAQMHDLASTKEVNELFKRAKQYNVIIISLLEMSPEN